MKKKMSEIIFEQIAPTEIKFKYRNHIFLLMKKDRGVYSLGRVCNLYKLENFDRKLIKTLGWIRSDNHGGMEKSEAYINNRLVSLEECKNLAVEYLDNLLN